MYCLLLTFRSHISASKKQHQSHVKQLLNLLQNPYRPITLGNISLCWGGIILFRRTVLIVLATYVEDSFLRLIMMFGVCLVSLLHHNVVWPYRDYKSSVAESVSECALLIICGVNLARSVLDSMQQSPVGPTQVVLQYLDQVDTYAYSD